MGGNALKNIETRRYQAEEYFRVAEKAINTLTNNYDLERVELIRSYREKESFGDADILYTTINDEPLPKTKFNGDIVKHLTGLKEKELGLFMRYLRDDFYFRKENIVYLEQYQLDDRIFELFDKYKEKQV